MLRDRTGATRMGLPGTSRGYRGPPVGWYLKNSPVRVLSHSAYLSAACCVSLIACGWSIRLVFPEAWQTGRAESPETFRPSLCLTTEDGDADCQLQRRLHGPSPRRLGRAVGNEQDVSGIQRHVIRLRTQDPLEVDPDLRPLLRSPSGAKDSRVTRR